eukprot:jgi/Ulvmu1/10545/UM064_0083.1
MNQATSASTEAAAGSSTHTVNYVTIPPSQPEESVGVMHLALAPKRRKKTIKWSDDTVDNEDLGKKKSKKCCVFHARRQFGDWSDDNDSDCDCTDP